MAFKFITAQKSAALAIMLLAAYQLINAAVMIANIKNSDCNATVFLPALGILASSLTLIYSTFTVLVSSAKAVTVRIGAFYICLLVRCISILLLSIYAG